ncbi:PaaI family thioesterase [Nocardia noduli]|uniref:PaaI family thioesterase n=1 Tax=Nocardia noduli TaxID=2815722 RepID=UPI001C23537E|nr:PaaI family thioesterase [Nocardia noduli]
MDAIIGDLVMAEFQKLGFIRYAGIVAVEFATGRHVVSIDPGPEHLNQNGDLHGPLLFGLAETAAIGAAISTIVGLVGDAFVVAKGGRIEYSARAESDAGPFIATSEVDAELLDRVRTDAVARRPVEFEVPVRVVDNTEKLVAEAFFTAVIRPPRT